jgi:hypothetical protein
MTRRRRCEATLRLRPATTGREYAGAHCQPFRDRTVIGPRPTDGGAARFAPRLASPRLGAPEIQLAHADRCVWRWRIEDACAKAFRCERDREASLGKVRHANIGVATATSTSRQVAGPGGRGSDYGLNLYYFVSLRFATLSAVGFSARCGRLSREPAESRRRIVRGTTAEACEHRDRHPRLSEITRHPLVRVVSTTHSHW